MASLSVAVGETARFTWLDQEKDFMEKRTVVWYISIWIGHSMLFYSYATLLPWLQVGWVVM